MKELHPIIGALASSAVQHSQQHAKPLPFITISRQAGAGGRTLKDKLVDRLKQIDPAQPPWQGFDRELVEKVCAETKLYEPLVAALGEESRSLITDLIASIGSRGLEPMEITVYRKVAKTIRALAQAGRVIIVGRGGVFLTNGMESGVHIDLVAPLEYRIAQTQKARNLSEKEAAAWVKKIDQGRQAFYSRYWPGRQATPEVFTAVFNTARVSDDAIVDAVLPLIPGIKSKLAAAHQRELRDAGRHHHKPTRAAG